MACTTGLMWQRYQEAGERLQCEHPELFPTVVLLVEALVDDNVLRKLIQDAVDISLLNGAE